MEKSSRLCNVCALKTAGAFLPVLPTHTNPRDWAQTSLLLLTLPVVVLFRWKASSETCLLVDTALLLILGNTLHIMNTNLLPVTCCRFPPHPPTCCCRLSVCSGRSRTLENCNLSSFLLTNWQTIFFLTFIYFWESETEHKWGRGRETGAHRIRSRLQALSWQHRARHGAQTHRPRDRDLSQSPTLNQLSHPGAPPFSYSLRLLRFVLALRKILFLPL